jgi:hypothetical protein
VGKKEASSFYSCHNLILTRLCQFGFNKIKYLVNESHLKSQLSKNEQEERKRDGEKKKTARHRCYSKGGHFIMYTFPFIPCPIPIGQEELVS